MSTEKEPDIDLKVGLNAIGLMIIGSFVLSPFEAIVMGTCCSKIWTWLIAPSLGEGPSWLAWYGLALIGGILLYSTKKASNQSVEKAAKKPIQTLLTISLERWFIFTMFTLSAAFTARVVLWLS